MRLRAGILALVGLSLGALLTSPAALASPAAARHSAAIAAGQHTYYIAGTTIDRMGMVRPLSGLAAVTVNADGTYTGTLTLAGTKPATMPVVGFVGPTGISLVSSGAHALAVLAMPATETIGNTAANGAKTTAGSEYRGTVQSADGLSGFVTVYDTGALREYSFAAHITQGPHRGADVNGSLYLISDASGELHGYFVRDPDGAMFPLLSGVLTSSQMLLHIDMSGMDILGQAPPGAPPQIVGVASESSTLIPNQIAYKGTFTGPSATDRGTWLSLPPEH